MKRNALVAFALVAFALSAAPRTAHAGLFGIGPRVGLSTGPDQFILGLGLVRPIAKNIEIAPSIDFGWPDNGFTTSINGDLRYTVAPESHLKPYVGAGVTWIDFNPDAKDVDSESKVGGNLIGGIWLHKGHWPEFNLEARVGLGDVPDFEAILGFNIL